MSNTGGGGGGHPFGDTTYTKVFVGGLAWETQKETMKKYFEQFGEILEAVIIIDKITGRSKGYGFVTFKEAEAAKGACVDPAPVIDGRRANCNLASMGSVQRSTSTTTKHGGGMGRNFRGMKSSFHNTGFHGGVATAFPYNTPPTLPHYAIQHGIPYAVSGYSPFSTNYTTYPTGYYVYGTVANGGNSNFYPYHHYHVQYGQGFDHIQYSNQHHVHYPLPHHYTSGHLPFNPIPPSQSGGIISAPRVQMEPHHPISSI